jgi:hypothetical protein
MSVSPINSGLIYFISTTGFESGIKALMTFIKIFGRCAMTALNPRSDFGSIISIFFLCENNLERNFVFGDYTEMKGDFSVKKG